MIRNLTRCALLLAILPLCAWKCPLAEGESGEKDNGPGANPRYTCWNTGPQLDALALERCSQCANPSAPNWQRTQSCTRPCIKDHAWVPGDCVNHCFPACPVQATAECGTCPQGETCNQVGPDHPCNDCTHCFP